MICTENVSFVVLIKHWIRWRFRQRNWIWLMSSSLQQVKWLVVTQDFHNVIKKKFLLTKTFHVSVGFSQSLKDVYLHKLTRYRFTILFKGSLTYKISAGGCFRSNLTRHLCQTAKYLKGKRTTLDGSTKISIPTCPRHVAVFPHYISSLSSLKVLTGCCWITGELLTNYKIFQYTERRKTRGPSTKQIRLPLPLSIVLPGAFCKLLWKM